MDSLTQIVLGAAVGEAVAGKKMGNKAALWGAVAGTIPDLDVIFRALTHPLDGALIHRGFSHSILFAILAAPVLAWVFERFYKRRYPFKLWFNLFFLAIITHPMLDIFTNYGTQFFWPFDFRITFNSVFVIDPIYTLPFMVCVVIALFLHRTSRWRRIINYSGIIFSCAYLLWCSAVKLVVLQKSETYFRNAGIRGERNMVTPMPFTSFYWLMITEDDSNYYLGYKSLFYSFKAEDIETVPKNHVALDTLKWDKINYTEQIKFISKGYYAMAGNQDTVIFYDLRFGMATKATNGRVRTPIMGFGMVIDNGIVKKTVHLRNRSMIEHLNFSSYFHSVCYSN